MGPTRFRMVHRSFHRGVIAQASSVEELAATMSEISQQVKENAETSQVVKTAAGEMGANILACNQQMQEMKMRWKR